MRGPTVLYHSRHPQNKILAKTLQKYLNKIEYSNLEPVNHAPQERKNLYILKAKKTPGVIVEVGFITNDLDRRLLLKEAYQEILVQAIYKGIEEYFSGFKFI